MNKAERVRYWRVAIPAAVAIVALGSLSGYLSNSGYSNAWFAALDKPWFIPPGWAFGVVWTTLYTLMAFAVALVWVEPESPRRRTALLLFLTQLAVNFAWSPIFFGMRMIEAGLILIIIMLLLAGPAALLFSRVRPLAGLLLLPYLAWLCLAAALNLEIGRLNPGADSAPFGIFGD